MFVEGARRVHGRGRVLGGERGGGLVVVMVLLFVGVCFWRPCWVCSTGPVRLMSYTLFCRWVWFGPPPPFSSVLCGVLLWCRSFFFCLLV